MERPYTFDVIAHYASIIGEPRIKIACFWGWLNTVLKIVLQICAIGTTVGDSEEMSVSR